jgi:hypothetical protein
MPRTLPTGAQAWLAKQGGGNIGPVILADIQTADGTQYFWSDLEGVFPSKVPLSTQIQTTGGTTAFKYFYGGVNTNPGDIVHAEILAWNLGTVDVTVTSNNGGAQAATVIPPGSMGRVVQDYTLPAGGARQLQLIFGTPSVGDSLNLICSDPLVIYNNVNQNVPANFSGSGWGGSAGSVPVLTQNVSGPKRYSGWIKNGFSFTRTRDFTSNAGDLVIQNLSGNTIDRDAAAALKNHEFEGALCIVQLWIPLLDAAIDEYHCSLSEATPNEDEVSFRLLQLFDPTQYFVADDVVSELCTLRFKSLACGSTAAGTACDKLFTTCKDANHVAQERFNAVLTIVPGNIFTPPIGAGNGVPPKPIINSGGNRGGGVRGVAQG